MAVLTANEKYRLKDLGPPAESAKLADRLALLDTDGTYTGSLGDAVTLATGQLVVGQADNVGDPKTLSGDATIDANGALTIAAKAVSVAKCADAIQDRVLTGTVTAAAEAAHARTITVQLKDAAGNNLAEQRLIRLCVNPTAALAAPAATATDTFGAPSAGTIHVTRTAKADYEVMTDAAGKYVFALTHNDAGSNRYIDAYADSKPISSAAIAFDTV
jgi:hypothetical protein